MSPVKPLRCKRPFGLMTSALVTSAPLSDKIPLERETRLQALESLQSRIMSINNEIIVKIAGLKRLQNELEPIHKLPIELFIDILAWTIDWPNWTLDQIHQLARVSKYWYNVIVSSPRFWPEIDVAQGKETTATVLKKNPAGPLVVRCTTRVEEPDQRLDFMKVSAQHHHRWKSLIFKGRLTDAIFPYLESPTPALSELFVYQYSGGESIQKVLHLSEGISLRHLDVDFVSVPWDSSRLTGLESLQIRNLTSGIPTLSQLHTILLACPNLRWLLLAKLTEAEATPAQPAPADEAAPAPTGTPPAIPEIIKLAPSAPQEIIRLPALTTLVLLSIPQATCHHLLSYIDSSVVRCLMTDDAHLKHFRDSSQTFFNLIKPAISAAKDIEMTYEEASGSFRVATAPLPEVSNEWIHWVKQTAGIDLVVQTQKQPEFWGDLSGFQTSMAMAASITLRLVGEGTEPDANATTETVSTFPDHTLGHFPLINRIKCSRHHSASAILRYLGRIQTDASGSLGWACPNLTFLELSRWRGDTDAMVDDVLAFARERYARSEDAESGMARPATLEKILVPEAIVERLRTEDVLQGVTIEAS